VTSPRVPVSRAAAQIGAGTPPTSWSVVRGATSRQRRDGVTLEATRQVRLANLATLG